MRFPTKQVDFPLHSVAPVVTGFQYHYLYNRSNEQHLDVTVDVGVQEVTCHFLIGLVTSAACYGIDPTFKCARD